MPLSLHTRIVATIWLLVVGSLSVPLTVGWALRSMSVLPMWVFGLGCICCVLGMFGLVDVFATAITRRVHGPTEPPIPVARSVPRNR